MSGQTGGGRRGGRSNYNRQQYGIRGRGGRGDNFRGRGNYAPDDDGGDRGNYDQDGGRGGRGRSYYDQYGGGRGHSNYDQYGGGGRGRSNYDYYGGGRGRRGRGGGSDHHQRYQSASPDLPVADSSSSARDPNFGAPWTRDGKLKAAPSRPWIPDRKLNTDLSHPPPRPGTGTMGQPCTVIANHFGVNLADWKKEVYHYDVKISPEVASSKDRRLIICELAKSHGASHLGELKLAYDGGKSMYTAGPLPSSAKKSFAIKWSGRKEDLTVDISFVGKYELQALKQFLRGQVMNTPQEIIQVLDVVLLVSHSLKHVRIGRSFFSQEFDNCKTLGGGLEIWNGFHQSIRPTQMGLSLNLNFSATPFYKPGPVKDFITKTLGLKDSDIGTLNENQRFKLQKALKGAWVVTTHMKRTYKITGITSLPLSELKFATKDRQMSVVQYFSETYHLTLQYRAWPCLESAKSNRSIYLPIEVCEIDARQRYSKKLNEGQTAELLNSTNKKPDKRKDTILKMVHENNYGNDEYARSFGINVTEQETSIEARVLPAPVLQFGRNKTLDPAHDQRNMNYKQMYTAKKVEYWACIDFSKSIGDTAHRFCMDVANACLRYGMGFNKVPVIKLYKAETNKVAEELSIVYKQCTTALGAAPKEQLQLLFVILPDRDSSFYGKIKQICETELGIVSQCCLKYNIFNRNDHYLANLALKINVKVGGRNMVLKDAVDRNIPLITKTGQISTIFFGADVTHPLAGEDSSFSIAAVAASMDWPEVTTYRAMVSVQKQRQEIITDLFKSTHSPGKDVVYDGIIRESLLAFNKKTNMKPGRIIFYRDGVGDGQFSEVRKHEIDAILKACESLEEGYRPSITFIIVKKRHHTRLFPAEKTKSHKSGNIFAGTVVDTMICHPREFDFYLCSHSAIQGTSRPTLYHVLLDENGFTADGLQLLTHHLCYTFARCIQSVSVVPAVYYAHLAAFRARFYSKEGAEDRNFEIKDYVKNVMYFC